MDKRGRNVQPITALIVVLLVIAGVQQEASASASFKGCFAGCAVSCLFRFHKFICVFNCFSKCLIGVSPLSQVDDCRLACAIDRCSHFAYDFKIEDIDNVVNCVDECESGKCGLSAHSITSEVLSPNGAPSPR